MENSVTLQLVDAVTLQPCSQAKTGRMPALRHFEAG